MVGVLVVLALFAQAARGDDVECTPEEEDRVIHDAGTLSRRVVFLILTALIVCTIAFELAKV